MNLLPPDAQKKIRRDIRARFLLAFSLVLLTSALLSALALVPAEVALAFFSPPATRTTPQTADVSQDAAIIKQTKGLVAVMQPFTATTSLDNLVAALSQVGVGITVSDISYSVSGHSLTLAGHAQTPSDVNTFRQNLQSDLRFTNVSVPVSALLGSQAGDYTITMKVAQ